MASLLYPDDGADQSQWPTSLLPVDTQAPPSDPRADALGDTYRTISDYMARQQAKSEAEGYWTGGSLLEGGHPTGKGLLDAIQQTGTAVALGTGAPGERPPPGFTVYHGSPHSFDAFDLSKIGTGEGAQAYGHGMYLADSEAIARSYRDKLSGGASPMPGASDYVPGFTVNGVLPPTGMAGHAAMDTAIDMHGLFNYMDMYANKPSMSMFWKQGDPIHPDFDARPSYVQSINYLKGQIENRIARFQDRLGGQESSGIADRDMAAISDYYNTHVKDATPYDVQKRPPGHMYEVNVAADPEHFLHWDKPLSEQHPVVQQALKDSGAWDATIGRGNPAQFSGRHAYDALAETLAKPSPETTGWTSVPGGPVRYDAQVHNPAAASQALQAAGIPGIRYLDQGSRGAGEGTHNTVVFSPEIMTIIRRYGLAGLMAGGGAAALGGQQRQQQQ